MKTLVLKESEDDKIVKSSESLDEFLMILKQAISDETTAIALYDSIIGMSKVPAHVRSIIEEIRDDEKDHLVLLTNLFHDEVEDQFQGYGDE